MKDQALLISEAAVLEPRPWFRTLSWTTRSWQLQLMELIHYLRPVALDRETHSVFLSQCGFCLGVSPALILACLGLDEM